ncbi:MAG: hypothetical protein LBU79_10295 [Planctomycetota bacterium]|jgi:transposase|nr:hypothetical protein [Planctomycetota bacterium]
MSDQYLEPLLTLYNRFPGYYVSLVETLGETYPDKKPKRLNVYIKATGDNPGKCGKCGKEGPCRDYMPARFLKYEPLMETPTYIAYRLRRINCSTCGPTLEKLPWEVDKAITNNETD